MLSNTPLLQMRVIGLTHSFPIKQKARNNIFKIQSTNLEEGFNLFLEVLLKNLLLWPTMTRHRWQQSHQGLSMSIFMAIFVIVTINGLKCQLRHTHCNASSYKLKLFIYCLATKFPHQIKTILNSFCTTILPTRVSNIYKVAKQYPRSRASNEDT